MSTQPNGLSCRENCKRMAEMIRACAPPLAHALAAESARTIRGWQRRMGFIPDPMGYQPPRRNP